MVTLLLLLRNKLTNLERFINLAILQNISIFRPLCPVKLGERSGPAAAAD